VIPHLVGRYAPLGPQSSLKPRSTLYAFPTEPQPDRKQTYKMPVGKSSARPSLGGSSRRPAHTQSRTATHTHTHAHTHTHTNTHATTKREHERTHASTRTRTRTSAARARAHAPAPAQAHTPAPAHRARTSAHQRARTRNPRDDPRPPRRQHLSSQTSSGAPIQENPYCVHTGSPHCRAQHARAGLNKSHARRMDINGAPGLELVDAFNGRPGHSATPFCLTVAGLLWGASRGLRKRRRTGATQSTSLSESLAPTWGDVVGQHARLMRATRRASSVPMARRICRCTAWAHPSPRRRATWRAMRCKAALAASWGRP